MKFHTFHTILPAHLGNIKTLLAKKFVLSKVYCDGVYNNKAIELHYFKEIPFLSFNITITVAIMQIKLRDLVHASDIVFSTYTRIRMDRTDLLCYIFCHYLDKHKMPYRKGLTVNKIWSGHSILVQAYIAVDKQNLQAFINSWSCARNCFQFRYDIWL